MGAKKLARLPNPRAKPNKVNTKPKYIGCRLKRKGLSLTRKDDFSNGLTVVFLFLNRRSAQTAMKIPKKTKGMPKKLYGRGIILNFGKRKFKTKAAIKHMTKYVGGIILFFFISLFYQKTAHLAFFYSIKLKNKKAGLWIIYFLQILLISLTNSGNLV